MSFILAGIIFISFGQDNKPIRDEVVTPVEDILKSPPAGNLGSHIGEVRAVEGFVTQYIEKGKNETTAYYLLKDDWGDIIRINTALNKPYVNKRYKVMGVVYSDPDNLAAAPFMSEKDRLLVSTRPFWERFKIPLIVLIALAALALILTVILTGRKKKATGVPLKPGDGFKTIKISSDPTKTLKFIPGKFEIISGADKGKSFQVAGYTTPKGSIVTIGRADVTGSRAYSHIKLEQKTVSREQAELIYRDGKLFLKNLTDVNRTQVDGVELIPAEEVEIFPGQIIRTGEVEFKYTL
jgi:hypothetical protein